MQRSASCSQAKNLIFVDNVRFWSMFSVIAVHCLYAATAGEPRRDQEMMTMVLSVPVKLGTIGFFLISGFLLGHKMQISPRGEYMGRRLKRVFLPWLMWASLRVADLCWRRRTEFAVSSDKLMLFGRQCYAVAMLSPFWFVPNLFLGMLLLLSFRKHLYDTRLGLALLAVNLFYAVNIYGQWVPSGHTEAVLGFVFYLWLGSFAAHRFQQISAWMDGVDMRTLLAATLTAACFSYGESKWIYHLRLPDPVNTLRMSNQVCAVLGVLTLMKVKRPAWPRFLKARRETFGLYLSHTLALEIAILILQATMGRYMTARSMSRATVLVLWPAVFTVTYGVALGLTKGLSAWPAMSWLVGVEGVRNRPVVAILDAAA